MPVGLIAPVELGRLLAPAATEVAAVALLEDNKAALEFLAAASPDDAVEEEARDGGGRLPLLAGLLVVGVLLISLVVLAVRSCVVAVSRATFVAAIVGVVLCVCWVESAIFFAVFGPNLLQVTKGVFPCSLGLDYDEKGQWGG
jgi:hypothetical protein